MIKINIFLCVHNNCGYRLYGKPINVYLFEKEYLTTYVLNNDNICAKTDYIIRSVYL